MGRTLADLSPPAGAKARRKRVGRGHGSGNGTTAGRGQKGQKSRSGGAMGPWFEGGQMPLQRRLPKRGFKNRSRVEYAPVNVGDLGQAFAAGDVVDIETLRAKGLVPRKAERAKLLGMGDLSERVIVRVQGCSASARQKVEASGGTVEIVSVTSARTPAIEAGGAQSETAGA